MPATKILVSRDVGSHQRSGALDKEGREDALRAHTSLGFSDSRERGRMPPRLAYIQSATYGRQSSTLERGGGEGTAAAADSTHSDASPDRGKPLSFPRRACFPPRLRVGAHGSSENAVPSHILTGLSGTARNRSVVDGFPMERPLQYLELEQLLHSVSDKMHTSNNQTWIASSQAFSRGSWPRPASRVAARDKDPNPSRPSSKDGSRPRTSERKLDGLRSMKGKGAAAVVNAKDGKPGLQGHDADARGEDVGEPGGTLSGNTLKEFLPSEASMQLLPESRGEKVNRSQSAMTWAKTLNDSDDQVLRPIRQKPKSVDELDMQAKQVEYASRPPPPLNKDERFHIGHVNGGDDIQIEPPRGTLMSSDADIVSLQRAMNLESLHVRDQLRRFAHGHVNKLVPKSTLLPPAKKYVWKEEIKKIRIEHEAAVLVQKYWRRCNRRKKFLKYSVNCLRRKIMCMKKIMQVWLRLSHQREHEHPPGSNVRGLMSYWLIRFNVSVKNAKIARDKAADCYDLWSSVWLKRVMRNWRKYLDVSSFDRLHRMNTWLQPWKDFYSDFCFVREAERKTTQRFVHAALRCLLFYARCSAKLKLRAKKLFRLEEDSVYELLMPIQRFPGYFNLFHPIAIMEKFRRKDWYERRVYRQCYKRIIPWVFSRWHGVAEQGRKWRVVVGAYDRLVLNRAFSAFCFLLVLDDLGQRVHVVVDREMDQERLLKEEATKKLGQEEDQLKELENSMDDLSGLVDYEHREMIRSMIRDEKHKTLFRIRCDALEKERNSVSVLVAAVTKDLEASAREQMEADETFIKKRKECEEFIADLRHDEIRKWDQNIQNVYDLFMRATDIMGNVLEQAAQLHAARSFRICWRTLCKPAFRVRMRRVYNRAHVQRLLKICFQFLKMERSIYKYYPLRVKFYAVMKWFKLVEFKYQHTSYGLKTLVRRRQDQYMALSNALRAFTEAQTFARAPNNQEFHTKVFVCLRWKECVQSVIARSEVVKLFRRRRAMHVASRCFDFLKHGVPVRLSISVSPLHRTFVYMWQDRCP
jgi:hypothetical protein